MAGGKGKRIALLGTAESLSEAPFNDESWEIWTVATALPLINRFRVDAVFELHDEPIWRKRQAHLVERAIDPTWMQTTHDDLPFVWAYPKDEIVAKYGRYQTCSITWMICLALEAGATEIGLWGLHLATNSEYSYERPGVEFHLCRAMERGVKVTVHPSSSILQNAYLYGFETPPHEEFLKSKRGEWIKRREETKAMQHKAEISAAEYSGAIEAANFIMREIGIRGS